MALRELSSLEKYLGLKKPNKYSTQGDKKVPVLQNNNGPPLLGLATIACHLVKEAKRPELLGDTAESRAVVQQWLEYRVTKLDSCAKEDIKIILKDLNLYLQDKVYLAGNRFTVADTLMYYGIHPLIVDLAVQEKEHCVGCSEQLSVSPRVRDQSEAPISPTTTTVDAAGQREGSGLTSCHTDPASQGQNPGPWATVSHCVSFQPSRSHGGYWREKDDGRQRERERERGREATRRKKSTQRPRDLFVTCEQ
uniref:Eukaryotic translation elongation factor 1 epsilon 1 n=1 Tax=Acanthochromis polyacanthus TaxID=80966 RepID=A0A3Q1G0Y4_9TELE